MKFSRIYHAVNFEPWLIMPEGHASISRLLAEKMQDHTVVKEMILQSPVIRSEDNQESVSIGGQVVPLPSPVMDENGIVTIPVEGIISRKVSGLERACGVTDVDVLSRWIASYDANPACKGMFFSYDTPGGGVGGVADINAQIRGLSKPSVAYTNGTCGSAGYWMFCGSDKCFADATANLGSIGVYLPFVDQSKAFEAQGLKVDVIKNAEGIYKAAGMPGTSLTDDQRQNIQERVQALFNMFVASVKSSRPDVSEEALKGQTFLGIQAVKAGLIDDVTNEDYARFQLKKMIGK